MAEHIPHYGDGGPRVTYTASATITAGQLVEITGNMTVGPAGAGSKKVVGVASRDTASGAQVMLYGDDVHDLTAAGAIAAGAIVIAGAAGTVATIGAGTFDQALGVALEAIADTAKGRVKLNRV